MLKLWVLPLHLDQLGDIERNPFVVQLIQWVNNDLVNVKLNRFSVWEGVEISDQIGGIDLELVKEGKGDVSNVFLDLILSETQVAVFELPPYFLVEPTQRMWLHKEGDELIGQVIDEPHQGLILIDYPQIIGFDKYE